MRHISEEHITKADENRRVIRENNPRLQSPMSSRVRNFMEMGDQPVRDFPGDPGKDVRRLAALLILEEAIETVRDLGFGVPKFEIVDHVDSKFNLEGAVDGCLDTIYVCHWALNAMGVCDYLPSLEVLDANDRKFAPGAYKDETGKVRKPEGWRGPDITGALEAQMPQ